MNFIQHLRWGAMTVVFLVGSNFLWADEKPSPEMLGYGFKNVCRMVLKESPAAVTAARGVLKTSEPLLAPPASEFTDHELSALLNQMAQAVAPDQPAILFRNIITRLLEKYPSSTQRTQLISEAHAEFDHMVDRLGLDWVESSVDSILDQTQNIDPTAVSAFQLPEGQKIVGSGFAHRVYLLSPYAQKIASRLLWAKLQNEDRTLGLKLENDYLDFLLELGERPVVLSRYAGWISQTQSVYDETLAQKIASGQYPSSAEKDEILRNVAKQQWIEFFVLPVIPKPVALLTYPAFSSLISYSKGADETKEIPVLKMRDGPAEVSEKEFTIFLSGDVWPKTKANRTALLKLMAHFGREEEISTQEVQQLMMDQARVAILLTQLWHKGGNDVFLLELVKNAAKDALHRVAKDNVNEFSNDIPHDLRDAARPKEAVALSAYESIENQWLKAMRIIQAIAQFQLKMSQ